MILKSWAGLPPSFQPYDDLQRALGHLVGGSVHPSVLWALSYFNGSVVLGFLFGRIYQLLPGRSGAVKGRIFGLIGWMVMGLLFFPLLDKGLFATRAGLGIIPSLFSLIMILTYSITLGVAYSFLNPRQLTS